MLMNDFPPEEEKHELAYTFFAQSKAEVPTDARWTSGPSLDGRGEFSVWKAEPMGQEPDELSPAPPESHAGPEATSGDGRPHQPGGGPTPSAATGVVDKVKEKL